MNKMFRPGLGRCLTFAMVIGLFSCLLVIHVSAKPETEWPQERIASLFPAPPKNLMKGEISIEKIDVVAGKFSSAGQALTGSGKGGPMRLKAVKVYTSKNKSITVTIDTEDINMVSQVTGLLKMIDADEAARSKLKNKGIAEISIDGRRGLLTKTKGGVASVFNVGKVGVVALECNYESCTGDLEDLMNALDFPLIQLFIDYDHHF